MRLRRHRAAAWFMAFVMPFQGVVAAYVAFQGPAHFHLGGEIFGHSHDGDDDDHHHRHRHDRAERHHHPASDRTVVVVDDDAALRHLATEEDASPGGATMTLLALVSPGTALHDPRTLIGIAPIAEPHLGSRFLGRLERPPPFLHA